MSIVVYFIFFLVCLAPQAGSWKFAARLATIYAPRSKPQTFFAFMFHAGAAQFTRSSRAVHAQFTRSSRAVHAQFTFTQRYRQDVTERLNLLEVPKGVYASHQEKTL
jgi:hypothetical protein